MAFHDLCQVARELIQNLHAHGREFGVQSLHARIENRAENLRKFKALSIRHIGPLSRRERLGTVRSLAPSDWVCRSLTNPSLRDSKGLAIPHFAGFVGGIGLPHFAGIDAGPGWLHHEAMSTLEERRAAFARANPEARHNPYDSSTWGYGCARGIEYKQTGAPVAAGTKAQVRKISSGRKHRGMASDSLSVR